MVLDEFWNLAGRERLKAQFALSEELSLVDRITIEALRAILLQYRFFTLAFATDIAVLVSRCPPSPLRSLMAELLSDELGRGDPTQAHPALFDRFLCSIGTLVPDEVDAPLTERRHDEVVAILDDLSVRTREASLSYAIGLRGMGGECVCGVYFEEMYRKLIQHPYIAAHTEQIDWTFWIIHAGHADAEHDIATRNAVAMFTAEGHLDLKELVAGYEHGVASWARFWRALYQTHVVPAHLPRAESRSRSSARS